MNNSKIRIYDLSRELNLENKDILMVCEELEIAVKSHSSTISEAEAVRIRATAQKLIARPDQAKKQPTAEKEKVDRAPAAKTGGEQKPQILQIRHKTSQEASSETQVPGIAPKPIAVQPSVTPLSNPERPARPQSAAPEAAPRSANEPTIVRAQPARAPERGSNEPTTSASPPRPTVKPVLKVAGAPVRPSGADRPARPAAGAGERRPLREVPAVPELNRPQRKMIVQIKPLASVGAVPGGDIGIDDDDSIDVIDNVEKLELRRPTLPKQIKKPKAWSKGEEEEAENAAKAAKAAGKKRKSQIIADDDDDDDEDGQGEDGTAVVVSLSIVRPPKPASAQRAATPIAAPARKKPTRASQ